MQFDCDLRENMDSVDDSWVGDCKSKKTRICILVPTHWSARRAGAEYQAKCLAEVLVASGKYDVFYLARFLDETRSPREYRVVRVGKGTGVARFSLLFDFFGVMRVLREIQPDVIYQRVGGPYTGIAAFYASRNNCKLVWHVASDNDLNLFRWNLSRDICLRYLEKKSLEYGVKRADHVVAQTLEQRELLGERYGRTPTAVIPNGHPLPKEEIQKGDLVKIVWIASMFPWKQPEIFIKLAYDFRAISNVRFLLIGGVTRETEWTNHLLSQIAGLENFDYLGACSQSEVNRILAESHILVNTSTHEGYPNTFIQAWMRKIPVVSLNVNPSGIFNKREIGYVSGTYENMKDQVSKLVSNRELRIQMGNMAQEYAFEHHSLSVFERLIDVIESS